MTELEHFGSVSAPLDLLTAPYKAGTYRNRHRRPREREFTQVRNGYGADLVRSQMQPEQFTLNVQVSAASVQELLEASDAIDLELALARSWHGLDTEDQPWLNDGEPIVATELVCYEWQSGNMTVRRRWDILDGDWDIDLEQYGGGPFQVVGVLTVFGYRIAVEEE